MARTTLAFNAFGQIVKTLEQPTQPAVSFITANPKAGDKISQPVKIVAMHFDDVTFSMKVMGSDMKMRECKILRLHTDNEQAKRIGRALWARCAAAAKASEVVHFRAAGGFNPDRWFYTVEV
jgi:hypothetical protein